MKFTKFAKPGASLIFKCNLNVRLILPQKSSKYRREQDLILRCFSTSL